MGFFSLVQPSMRLIKLGKHVPQSMGSFIAPTATVVGRVNIGEYSSIWYGAVLRGDVSSISIGKNSYIGDRTMIHCSSHPKELPTIVGNNCVVEGGAILHGCVLEDNTYVGEGSQIMDGARVQKNAVIAAGSLVSIGKVVPSGQLWAGCPATFQRNLSAEEVAAIESAAHENAELAVFHAAESEKNYEAILRDEEEYQQTSFRHPEYFDRVQDKKLFPSYRGPGSILESDCKPHHSRLPLLMKIII
jgi:carbonic anhydrase/acetyltransferase-like protein (isoleucine patch superfamily)